jgi:hypothetical protein
VLDFLGLETLPFLHDPWQLIAIVAVLIVAGTVKGVSGVGLPIVGLPLLALVIDLKSAIQLMSITMVTSNFGQMNAGGHIRESLDRYLALSLACIAFTFAGAFALKVLPSWVSYTVGGCLLMAAGANFFWQIRIVMPPRVRKVASPVVGAVAGTVGGMTGIFGPVIIFYLSLVEHEKDRFVAAISLIYLFASFSLLASQFLVAGMTIPWLVASVGAVIPVQTGITIGNRIRNVLPQDTFRKLLAFFIFAMGAIYFSRAFGI